VLLASVRADTTEEVGIREGNAVLDPQDCACVERARNVTLDDRGRTTFTHRDELDVRITVSPHDAAYIGFGHDAEFPGNRFIAYQARWAAVDYPSAD